MSFAAVNAQNYDTTTFYGKQNFIFAPLDKTKITTGLLREYGIDFTNPDNYTGKTLHDSNWVTLTDWRMLYTSLYSQQINSNAGMLYLDTVNKRIGQYALSNMPVSFICLDYNFQGLDTNAVSRNLISISNGQLHDVAPASSAKIIIPTPYITYSAFAVATTQQKIFTGSTQLIFRPQLFFSNTGKTIAALAIDPFGNGAYQTANFNTPITVNYADTGLYTINIKISYTDGTINYSHTKVAAYPNPESVTNRYGIRPTINEPVIAARAYLGQLAQGDITIDLAQSNATGQIRKPLIIVEGFDPDGAFNYDEIITRISRDINQLPFAPIITLNQDLDDIGDYDLIFLNFANGTDYIQRNAYLLEAVIENINNRKIPLNGVMQQNVITGMSMGGLVVRFALRDMEILNVPHDTRLFISHDAPHWGANVPVAYQALVQQLAPWQIINVGGNFPFISYQHMFPDAVDGVNLFNTPAAKQMLIQRYSLTATASTPFTGTYNLVADNTTHTAFMNEINTMGWPANCRNVTLSNGACDGGIRFPNNSQMLSIYGSKPMSYFGGMWRSLLMTLGGSPVGSIGTFGTVPANNMSLLLQFPLSIITTKGTLYFDFGAWAVPNPGITPLIYKGDAFIKRQLFWGLFNTTSYLLKCRAYSSSDMIPLDNAPGGQYDLQQFNISIDGINNQLHQQLGTWINASVAQQRFCFVPTVSSLALVNPQQNLTNPLCNNLACLRPNNVADYFAPTATDQIHISYTQPSSDWILNIQNANQNCMQVCTNISGADAFCNSGTYSIPNLPVNATVTWSADPAGIVNISPTVNSNPVTLTKVGDGFVNLTATITGTCSPNPVVGTKIIAVGNVVTAYYNVISNYVVSNYNPFYFATGSVFQPAGQNVLFSLQVTTPNLSSVSWTVSGSYSTYYSGSSFFNLYMTTPNSGAYTRNTAYVTLNAIGPCGPISYTYTFHAIVSVSGFSITTSPNPANGKINLSIAKITDTVNVQNASSLLSNTSGRTKVYLYDFNTNILVKQWTYQETGSANYSLNVTGIKKGIYVLKVERDNQTKTSKVILQ